MTGLACASPAPVAPRVSSAQPFASLNLMSGELAIQAEDLHVSLRGRTRAEGRGPGGGDRHRARAARPERRGQDHRRAHPHHAAAPDRGQRAGGRASTWSREAAGAPAPHRPRRPVRGGRREPHRLREPRDGRPALPPGRAPARERADELLERFELDEAAEPARAHLLGRHAPPARPRRLAGGAARRCCSSTSPPPGSTRAAAWSCWRRSRRASASGTTVLLTTQYLDEADRLADRIAVIDHGR